MADMAVLNPEAIQTINENPDIFEIVIRPFSHDIALTRTLDGFIHNLELGKKVIRHEFKKVIDWYLPPEFMLTGRQIKVLMDAGIQGVFINPGRFAKDVSSRLPKTPYMVKGVAGSQLPCIPFADGLTSRYLESIQRLSPELWVMDARYDGSGAAYLWRDGESCFLLPDSVSREEGWLRCSGGSQRVLLSGSLKEETFRVPSDSDAYRSYPVHSFAAWMKEMSMLGFLQAVSQHEACLPRFGFLERVLWLMIINSDILSAVEKKSPVVRITRFDHGGLGEEFDLKLARSERGFEGEDYLHMLGALDLNATLNYIENSDEPHVLKLRNRMKYIAALCRHEHGGFYGVG